MTRAMRRRSMLEAEKNQEKVEKVEEAEAQVEAEAQQVSNTNEAVETEGVIH